MRTRGWVLVGTMVALALGSLPASAAERLPERAVSGDAAIARLGGQLPSVAQRYGRSAVQLEQMLRADPTLQVDATGTLSYADEAPDRNAADVAAPLAGTTAYAAEQAFTLHSKPSSLRTIYLDFTGHLITATGWNVRLGGDCTAAPFDKDGDPTSFGPSERATIAGAWQRIAEDFVPFDVDVTTEEPPAEAINRIDANDQEYGTRIVFTQGDATRCPNGLTLVNGMCDACVGTARIGSFADWLRHAYLQPSFVFTNALGTTKEISETGAHETGHTLNLFHDGKDGGEYYDGAGPWAPTMGRGRSRPVTQWSAGEYPGATNLQDDLAVMAKWGAPLRADDHGDTTDTATPLTTGAPASGVIGTRTDVDTFRLEVGGAWNVGIEALPAPLAPNLDIRLEVRDAAGTLVAADDPAVGRVNADRADGLDAGIATSLPAGTYTVTVDGVGHEGDYSDYGSLGAYTLRATGGASPPGAVAKSAPANDASGLALTGTSLAWGAAAGATAYEYCIDPILDGACSRGWVPTGTETTATLPYLDPNTTYEWQARALNAGGTTYADGAGWWRLTSIGRPAPFAKTAPALGAAKQDPTATVLAWAAAPGATSYEYCLDFVKNYVCDTSWISVGAATNATVRGLVPGKKYSWQVRASNAVDTRLADIDTWWSFTTTASRLFTKRSPTDGAPAAGTAPKLTWKPTARVTRYEYCIDTTDDNSCDTGWVFNGKVTATQLTGLTLGTTYFWQVRAVSETGTVYANADTWWRLTP